MISITRASAAVFILTCSQTTILQAAAITQTLASGDSNGLTIGASGRQAWQAAAFTPTGSYALTGAAPVSEPAAFLLVLLGFAVMGLVRRQKRTHVTLTASLGSLVNAGRSALSSSLSKVIGVVRTILSSLPSHPGTDAVRSLPEQGYQEFQQGIRVACSLWLPGRVWPDSYGRY